MDPYLQYRSGQSPNKIKKRMYNNNEKQKRKVTCQHNTLHSTKYRLYFRDLTFAIASLELLNLLDGGYDSLNLSSITGLDISISGISIPPLRVQGSSSNVKEGISTRSSAMATLSGYTSRATSD